MADIPEYKEVLPPLENLTDGKYTDDECIKRFNSLRELTNTFRWEVSDFVGRYKMLVREDLYDIEFSYVTDRYGNTILRATLRSNWDLL